MRQFIADASHELRTPLTSVRGTAELYRQGGIPETEVPEAFGRVEAQARRMGLLVDELLLLARLDAQRPLELHTVDLLQVCSEAVQGFANEPVTLSVLPDSGAPLVHGDTGRLRQVVDNLIANGLQHGRGTVTVAVGTEGSSAIVRVSDEGPGVAPQVAERVFDRFYRGAGDRSRTTGGSGLGLSIVAALVAAHGGSVSVSGPTFTVRVPLAD
jgi:two-component system OmpR family sensor kinase